MCLACDSAQQRRFPSVCKQIPTNQTARLVTMVTFSAVFSGRASSAPRNGQSIDGEPSKCSANATHTYTLIRPALQCRASNELQRAINRGNTRAAQSGRTWPLSPAGKIRFVSEVSNPRRLRRRANRSHRNHRTSSRWQNWRTGRRPSTKHSGEHQINQPSARRCPVKERARASSIALPRGPGVRGCHEANSRGRRNRNGANFRGCTTMAFRRGLPGEVLPIPRGTKPRRTDRAFATECDAAREGEEMKSDRAVSHDDPQSAL